MKLGFVLTRFAPRTPALKTTIKGVRWKKRKVRCRHKSIAETCDNMPHSRCHRLWLYYAQSDWSGDEQSSLLAADRYTAKHHDTNIKPS
jgi:hypothetical protein